MTTLASLTVHFPLATFTTIGLSLVLCAFGFFAGGYYGGHSSLSNETSAGVRRTWVPIFLLIGLGGLFFAIRETLFSAVPMGQSADTAEVVLIILISMALGLAVTGIMLVGLHERFALATAWSLGTVPAVTFIITETLVILNALKVQGVSQGPDFALFYFGAFEALAVLFMLFFIYGPRALGDRDPNALLMLTGLVLFSVAPLIYTLGTQSAGADAVINPAGLFLTCHLIGLFFVFLAALPPTENAAEVSAVAVTAQPKMMQPNTVISISPSGTPYIERGASLKAVDHVYRTH